VNIQGRLQYLWRAVDQDGDVIDILVQSRRDRRAAERFFRKLLKGQGRAPRRLITDKLRSYAGRAIAQQADLEGSKDHPLISRYPGSYIRNYLQKEFDEFGLPLGKLSNEKLSKFQQLEGKITYPATRGFPREISTFVNCVLALPRGFPRTNIPRKCQEKRPQRDSNPCFGLERTTRPSQRPPRNTVFFCGSPH
jgi:DDE superfamily endonuclease